MRKVKFKKNKLYSVVNLKENVEIVVKFCTSHSSARIVQSTMVEITDTEPERIFACTVANRAMTRRVASNSRRRKCKMTMPVILAVTLTGETTSHKIWFDGIFEVQDPNK
jgi:hypothetical protein